MSSRKPFSCWTRVHSLRVPLSMLMALIVSCICPAQSAQIIVCPMSNTDSECEFSGNLAIQSAVDHASNGDTILVRAGIYSPQEYRDVKYQNLVIRAYIVVDGKDLKFAGESGTVLDGSTGERVSAIVVNRGAATIDNFTIRNFKVASADDDLYDGHGIFVIGSKTDIRNVRFENIEKMSVSIRDTSDVSLTNVEIVDGHVGIWTQENAKLRVENSLFRNNDSAGIAAYASSFADIRNSVFDGNLDDGIYAESEAVIDVSNSVFIRNKPYAIRGVDDTQISVDFSIFHHNEINLSTYSNTHQIRTGQNIFDVDPKTDNDYRPLSASPLIDSGDPEILDPDGSVSDIGLYGGPGSAVVSPEK